MSTPVRTTLLALLAIAAGVVVFSLSRSDSGVSATTQAAPPGVGAGTAVVATVDGETITVAELDAALGAELGQLEQQIYEMRRQRLDQLIGEKLLAREAARRQVAVDALRKAEILDKVTAVTDEEVTRFYEANKARLPNAPNIRDQIRRYLEMQGVETREAAYLDSLRASTKVAVTLEAPPIRRAHIDVAGAPIRGDAAAPVTIVEFSDFHCPFCRSVQPTLLQVLDRYKGKVRLVYKDLPLDGLHPNARRASEAARCAGQQGRFWEFHDAIYSGAAGTDVSAEALRKLASAAALDVEAFEQCLAKNTHEAGIRRDLAQAQQLGLSGTPAFFVNGRLLTGAQPFEAFAKVIDEELAASR